MGGEYEDPYERATILQDFPIRINIGFPQITGMSEYEKRLKKWTSKGLLEFKGPRTFWHLGRKVWVIKKDVSIRFLRLRISVAGQREGGMGRH